MKKSFFDKTQNHDLFISPKRKNAVLEMSLKSFIMSKLDQQMSKSWKQSAAHKLETTSKLDLLKNWVPDFSAQDRILTKTFFIQNMSSRFTSSPVGKVRFFDFYHFHPSLPLWKMTTLILITVSCYFLCDLLIDLTIIKF